MKDDCMGIPASAQSLDVVEGAYDKKSKNELAE